MEEPEAVEMALCLRQTAVVVMAVMDKIIQVVVAEALADGPQDQLILAEMAALVL